ncbi:ATP-binding protein [Anaerobacillus sp. MEB173]|uniref:ATP-binding protein n=1 Tax=Anaerobacillus sp. MEB173 TaxID=3383345 RepID=UPI003F908F8B
MNNNIEVLLLNVLFIIVPILLYQLFWIDRDKGNHKVKKVIPILFASGSVILCLGFPVVFAPGFTFDLRHVPLLLGTLYGGFRYGIILFLTIAFYRLFIGGEGVYINYFVISSIILTGLFLRTFYLKIGLSFKVLLASLMSIVSASMVFFLFFIFYKNEAASITLVESLFPYALIQGLTTALTIYLIEAIRRNILIREQAIQTEKAQVVSQLAASISHEVRNPLTVVKGFLQLLQSDDVSTEKRKNYVNLSLSELNRAETIINDFLSFAKPSTKKMTQINIIDEMKHVQNILSPYALMNHVQIKLDSSGKYSFIGDQQSFRQCLINMGKNSIEAMPQGGTLHFVVSGLNDTILIDIKDTGEGMTSDQIEKLGTPYFSTKEKGTGLGMTVVFSVIESLGGQINVKSELGEGTCFTVRLPAVTTLANQKIN